MKPFTADILKANRRVQARTLHALDQLTVLLDDYTVVELAAPDERLAALLALYGRTAYLADRSRRLVEGMTIRA